MADGPYSRIYWTVADDPMFERVYNNDHALATWVRMLVVADAMYPASAPMPRRNPTVRLLIEVGLVIEKSANRYSIRGLEANREHRSKAGRNAAASRWKSERNADPMLREERIGKEKSNGQSPSMMGWKPRPTYERAPGEAANPRHDGSHPATCLVCHPPLREGIDA